jgi:hypothetical protein
VDTSKSLEEKKNHSRRSKRVTEMEERDKRREKESHENGGASLRAGKRIVRTGMIEERPTAKRRKDLGLTEDRGDGGSNFTGNACCRYCQPLTDYASFLMMLRYIIDI